MPSIFAITVVNGLEKPSLYPPYQNHLILLYKDRIATDTRVKHTEEKIQDQSVLCILKK